MKIIFMLAILAAMLTMPTVFGAAQNPVVSVSTPVMAQDAPGNIANSSVEGPVRQ